MSPVPGANFLESSVKGLINPVLDKLNIFSNLEIHSLNLFFRKDSSKSVSYTHLTLPTKA